MLGCSETFHGSPWFPKKVLFTFICGMSKLTFWPFESIAKQGQNTEKRAINIDIFNSNYFSIRNDKEQNFSLSQTHFFFFNYYWKQGKKVHISAINHGNCIHRGNRRFVASSEMCKAGEVEIMSTPLQLCSLVRDSMSHCCSSFGLLICHSGFSLRAHSVMIRPPCHIHSATRN